MRLLPLNLYKEVLESGNILVTLLTTGLLNHELFSFCDLHFDINLCNLRQLNT